MSWAWRSSSLSPTFLWSEYSHLAVPRMKHRYMPRGKGNGSGKNLAYLLLQIWQKKVMYLEMSSLGVGIGQ